MASAGGAGAGSDLEDHAIPFITIDAEDKFEVNAEAVAYLRSLTGRIAVISVAGLYRTGKSYLLNMLMGKAGGFTVGPTVKACTKGLWIWGKAVEVDGADTHFLFIDSEGLGSTVRSESYDVRIFALAILLSSFFMYNSFGTIDGTAISKLSLVLNLTKHIHVRSQGSGREDSGTEFNQFFPAFMWIIRDFTVKLEKDGRRISAREYLEDALKPEDGLSEAVEAKNAVRMLIRNFFPERDCVTMVRPVADEKALANLTSLTWDALRPEFRMQVETLRKKIFAAARPKTMYGKALNGSMLASLAMAYCTALNTNAVPTISTAWDRVVDSQCSDAVEAAAQLYSKRLRDAVATSSRRALAERGTLAAKLKLNMQDGPAASATSASQLSELLVSESYGDIAEEEELVSAHTDSSQAAFRLFQLSAVQDPDKTPPFEAALRDKITAEYSRLRRSNDANSAAYCTALLDVLRAQAGQELQSLRRTPATGSSAGARSGAHAEDDSGSAADRAKAAADGVVSAGALAKAYREACGHLQERFGRAARGPAKHRVLATFAVSVLPDALADGAYTVDDSYSGLVAALNARATDAANALAVARGKIKASEEIMAGERKSHEAALNESARQSAEAAERLKFQLDTRNAELSRLQEQFDALLANMETQSVRHDAAAEKGRAELAAANKKVEDLQSSKITTLLEISVMAQRLAEAEAARTEAERLYAEMRIKLAEESRSASVLLERCRAAENETVRLREQTDLLYEANKVAKQVMRQAKEEKEECEYQ